MTHPFIGTWRSEANPKAFLRFTEDHQVQGSDGINRLVTTWDEDGTIASAAEGSDTDVSTDKGTGSRATIRPAMTTLMATPNLQAWVTGARSVEVRGDELVVFDIRSHEVGTLRRDDAG
ncbi:hypothetical protein DFO66_103188 [Brevibacterium sanguinis]|uniref:META domain-containing protein n=2 Tax=Brevibacterium TaxID=1696 RepID=A0A366IMU0_9MICO|nr:MULTISPECIES: hypothetical protein [Brevibacterium]RBP66244.1 hypothetical protein DFO66_103188 [Brevibacterium sanguinis]RBP72895.1 hypothetical protein DFO65_103187 [Brevibacterium celere]